jgi:hypothetical protein
MIMMSCSGYGKDLTKHDPFLGKYRDKFYETLVLEMPSSKKLYK